MTVRWPNVFALALMIFAMVLFLSHAEAIAAAIQSMGSIGPHTTTEDRVVGLIALGLIGVTLVAIVRLLTARGGQP